MSPILLYLLYFRVLLQFNVMFIPKKMYKKGQKTKEKKESQASIKKDLQRYMNKHHQTGNENKLGN